MEPLEVAVKAGLTLGIVAGKPWGQVLPSDLFLMSISRRDR